MQLICSLEEAVKRYDLVLVDSNIFCPTSFGETIYEAKSPGDLSELESELREAYFTLTSQLDAIAESDNVYTVPGVVSELREFKGILSESLNWHQNKLGKSSVRKTRKEASANPHATYSSPEALHLLNNLCLGVEALITNIQVYTGPYASSKEDNSGTPTQLFRAAIGFVEENPEKSINIVSYGDEVNGMLQEHITREVIRQVEKMYGPEDMFKAAQP